MRRQVAASLRAIASRLDHTTDSVTPHAGPVEPSADLVLAARLEREEQNALHARERQEWAEREANLRAELEQETRVTTESRVRAQRLLELAEAAAGEVGTSATELTRLADELEASAQAASTQAVAVSAASAIVSRNVQTMAAGTNEMMSSIREIAHHAASAAGIAQGAVTAAGEAGAKVTQLGSSSRGIDRVVKLILGIAQQTNLLALNATIEAARAGEAGKGFAVVANEVKELAKETARATEEIGSRIKAIQTDSTAVVEAIGDMGMVVRQISEVQMTIATEVERQTVTASAMGRYVAEAAKGSAAIEAGVTGVARAAEETRGGADGSRQAAQTLAGMAAELQTLVGGYRHDGESVTHAPTPLGEIRVRGDDRRRTTSSRN